MSKLKKLYCMDQESLDKLEKIKQNNPTLSMSEIVNAIIRTTPDSIKINVECSVTYDVDVT